MRTNPDFDFVHLSAAARIRLAQDLWESLTPEEVDAESQPTPAQEAELDRRLAELEQNPDAGTPWEHVRAELEEEFAKRDRMPRGV